MEEFASAFGDADTLQVVDIYAASEEPIEGVTAEVLAGAIRAKGEVEVEYAASFEDAVKALTREAQRGDVIVTLGAGSISQTSGMLLDRLTLSRSSAS